MKTYYTGKRAAFYNRTWKRFSEKTLAATCSAIDLAQLQEIARTRELRILDVACGTGLLLQWLANLIPQAKLYGVDESQDMLAQASQILDSSPHIHLMRAALKRKTSAHLPYAPASFDLITCTNAFHYLDDPVTILHDLSLLLRPQGQMIIEDYAHRSFPFPWQPFEWLIKHIDPQHVRAYSLLEARVCCQSAGLQVLDAQNFSIDLLWRGWVIRVQRA